MELIIIRNYKIMKKITLTLAFVLTAILGYSQVFTNETELDRISNYNTWSSLFPGTTNPFAPGYAIVGAGVSANHGYLMNLGIDLFKSFGAYMDLAVSADPDKNTLIGYGLTTYMFSERIQVGIGDEMVVTGQEQMMRHNLAGSISYYFLPQMGLRVKFSRVDVGVTLNMRFN